MPGTTGASWWRVLSRLGDEWILEEGGLLSERICRFVLTEKSEAHTGTSIRLATSPRRGYA